MKRDPLANCFVASSEVSEIDLQQIQLVVAGGIRCRRNSTRPMMRDYFEGEMVNGISGFKFHHRILLQGLIASGNSINF